MKQERVIAHGDGGLEAVVVKVRVGVVVVVVDGKLECLRYVLSVRYWGWTILIKQGHRNSCKHTPVCRHTQTHTVHS